MALIAALPLLGGGVYGGIAATAGAQADGGWGAGPGLRPGNLLVFTSTYQPATITPGSTVLPPGCTSASAAASGIPCSTAGYSGTYPQVFNNDVDDGNFGVSSPIVLDEIDPDSGHLLGTIPVPTSDLVTSFSSKSEGALNLSTNGKVVSFIGYAAPSATLDVSASNAPGAVDPTNPVTSSYYRTVATLNRKGQFHFTETNAYTGDNGRAAIVAGSNGGSVIFMAGNAGNGNATFGTAGTTQFSGVVLGAGAQSIAPSLGSEAFQNPGAPTPVGSFDVTQLGDKQDKIGKDDNFRGLTIYNNVLYYTKGSGGNGVNTVYFVDTTGTACPGGVGLPQPGATLPTAPLDYNLPAIQAGGPLPSNMCILKGFPTLLAKSKTGVSYPFGIWFANPDTVYLADEGSGDNTYSTATGTYTNALPANNPTAGLQKWVFDPAAGQWNLAYTLTSGLNLGQPYTVPGYPTADNPETALPWSPATDGLRNITGRVNPDGTATIWAESSTVSGGGDQGADPNKLYMITDNLDATALPTTESFTAIDSAGFGQVLRGVSFTPGTATSGLGRRGGRQHGRRAR
ncbi:MAG: hypothetical protein ACLP50_23390 [Solirubrobacteraceae bacterium]